MRKSVFELQYKLFALACGVVFLLLFLGAAYAQQAINPPARALPSSTELPPEAVAAEREAAQPIPPPPPIGRAQRQGLPGNSKPSPEALAEDQSSKERIPPAPARSSSRQLVEKIRKKPGGPERIDAAQKGRVPEEVKTRSEPTASLLNSIGSFFISEAVAQKEINITDGSTSSSTSTNTTDISADSGSTTPPPEGPFSLELSPLVSSTNGSHNGLYSYPHHAIFYGAMINRSYPNNSSIRLLSNRNTGLGYQVTNPYAYLRVSIPVSGWYTIE